MAGPSGRKDVMKRKDERGSANGVARKPTSPQARYLRSLAGGPPYREGNNRQVIARLRSRCQDEGWVTRLGELTALGKTWAGTQASGDDVLD